MPFLYCKVPKVKAGDAADQEVRQSQGPMRMSMPANEKHCQQVHHVLPTGWLCLESTAALFCRRAPGRAGLRAGRRCAACGASCCRCWIWGTRWTSACWTPSSTACPRRDMSVLHLPLQLLLPPDHHALMSNRGYAICCSGRLIYCCCSSSFVFLVLLCFGFVSHGEPPINARRRRGGAGCPRPSC